MTSHAAVVARGMGKCCVAGCGAVRIDEKGKKFSVGGEVTIAEGGEILTINGSTGEVIKGGAASLIEPELSGEFAEISHGPTVSELSVSEQMRTHLPIPKSQEISEQRV